MALNCSFWHSSYVIVYWSFVLVVYDLVSLLLLMFLSCETVSIAVLDCKFVKVFAHVCECFDWCCSSANCNPRVASSIPF